MATSAPGIFFEIFGIKKIIKTLATAISVVQGSIV